MTDFYKFQVSAADGSTYSLDHLRGKVVLIVNVASKCGFTPQYESLELLYKRYNSQGLEILGFPCNQFGGQEPGTNADIQEFCRMSYGVSFPIMAKVDVNGENTAPIYKWLKKSATGILGTEAIKWNFTKFLLDKQGHVLERYAPQTRPEDLEPFIQHALQQQREVSP